MTNPYKIHLSTFFESITDFKHKSNRLNKVLREDVKKYTADGAKYFSATSLVIGDWTGPTDNGWKLPFHSGINKITEKENYAHEVENLLSREFGLTFSQCFEAFETLLKDLIHTKILNDEIFKSSLPDNIKIERSSLKGGEDIFKLIKKAGGERFKKYSKQNNNNFKFAETFKVFSEIRHSIIHSKGQLKTSKIPKDVYYKKLFEHMLPLNKLQGETIQLKFQFNVLNKLLIYISEFDFQIFKILSEEDKYDWKT
ncbi:hypothetical protein [Aquimarina celericrescens]|uniref:RiboL-PSP-HEPN domain-containing protein n=1 Tax=Aquimarina celericrescens TaxID=1964542 RepID=A0ABW5B3G6_9FLAO|nr:hypothetical protein [Aquimarina celericrescens]